MKKDKFYNTIILLLLIILQSTKFNFMSIYSIKPDFILLFVCLISLREGSISGTVFGFIGGIIQDLFSNGILGAGAFGKSLWGYLIGKSTKRLDTASLPVQIGLVFFFSVFDGLLINLLGFIFHYSAFLKGKFLLDIFAQAIYNCIVWPIFTYVFVRIKNLLKLSK